MLLPKIRFIGHVLRLLYLMVEVFLPFVRAIRLAIAAILSRSKNVKLAEWGKAQWWAFNVDTAAMGYGKRYRTVSGIAAELAPKYPRYRMFRDFIDRCSEPGHCQKEFEWEQKFSMDAYEASKTKTK